MIFFGDIPDAGHPDRRGDHHRLRPCHLVAGDARQTWALTRPQHVLTRGRRNGIRIALTDRPTDAIPTEYRRDTDVPFSPVSPCFTAFTLAPVPGNTHRAHPALTHCPQRNIGLFEPKGGGRHMLTTIPGFDRIGEENAFAVLARAGALAAEGQGHHQSRHRPARLSDAGKHRARPPSKRSATATTATPPANGIPRAASKRLLPISTGASTSM